MYLGRGHPGQSLLARQEVDSWHPDVLDLAAFVVSRNDGSDAMRVDAVNSVEYGLELGPVRPVPKQENSGQTLGINEVGDVFGGVGRHYTDENALASTLLGR